MVLSARHPFCRVMEGEEEGTDIAIEPVVAVAAIQRVVAALNSAGGPVMWERPVRLLPGRF